MVLVQILRRKPRIVQVHYLHQQSLLVELAGGEHVNDNPSSPKTQAWERSGRGPSFRNYVSTLRRYGILKKFSSGKMAHSNIVKDMINSSYLDNLVIDMYGKCSALQEAFLVFYHIEEKNLFSWNIMLGTYTRCGCLEEGRCLFDNMPEHDIVSWNTLLTIEAQQLFDGMPVRDIVSWTAMITAYSNNKQGREALELYKQMQQEGIAPDRVTYLTIIDVFAVMKSLSEGKQLHEHMSANGMDVDLTLSNALINMYGKCESPPDARAVFEKLTQRDVITWTTMLTPYVENDHSKKALELFREMQNEGTNPNEVTYLPVLQAYAAMGALAGGRRMHACILHANLGTKVVLENALMYMYGKCGHVIDLFEVFNRMMNDDVMSWNTVLAAYVQNGFSSEALQLFQSMNLKGIKPSEFTYATILDALADSASLEKGKQIHQWIMQSGFKPDVVVGNALIHMYAKCGSLEGAIYAFGRMQIRDLVSWNALLAAYSQCGCVDRTIQFFQQMQMKGIVPDRITLLCVLFACSHGGLLDNSFLLYISASQQWGLSQTIEHSHCMADLLSRSGKLDEAENFLGNMIFEPSPNSWTTLLGACRNFGDVQQGKRIAEYLFSKDPENESSYILLSNMVAATIKQDSFSKVQ